MKKKADKPNVTINVNILSNIKLDGKSLICIIIAIICLTLVFSDSIKKLYTVLRMIQGKKAHKSILKTYLLPLCSFAFPIYD